MALAPFFGVRDPFDEFFSSPMVPFPRSDLATRDMPSLRAMALDVVEFGDKVGIMADLPGLEKKDINVEVDKNLVTIKVDKSEEKKEEGPKEGEEGTKWHRYERSQHFVQRTVRLPETCDTDNIKARYENGVLKLDVPKKPEHAKAGAKRINVD